MLREMKWLYKVQYLTKNTETEVSRLAAVIYVQ